MASSTVSVPRVAPARSARGSGRGARTRARASREPPPPRGRRDALLEIVGTLAFARDVPGAHAAAADAPPPPPPPRGPAGGGGGRAGVSTSSFRTPANYLPPWEYLESDADALESLVRTLRRRPGAVVRDADAARGYVAATLEYPDGADEYEFFFTRDGSKTVLFRAQSRVTERPLPVVSPPGA